MTRFVTLLAGLVAPTCGCADANLQTFGMKNKNKSAKVQRFVQEVAKQQAQAGKSKQEVRIGPRAH